MPEVEAAEPEQQYPFCVDEWSGTAVRADTGEPVECRGLRVGYFGVRPAFPHEHTADRWGNDVNAGGQWVVELVGIGVVVLARDLDTALVVADDCSRHAVGRPPDQLERAWDAVERQWRPGVLDKMHAIMVAVLGRELDEWLNHVADNQGAGAKMLAFRDWLARVRPGARLKFAQLEEGDTQSW